MELQNPMLAGFCFPKISMLKITGLNSINLLLMSKTNIFGAFSHFQIDKIMFNS